MRHIQPNNWSFIILLKYLFVGRTTRPKGQDNFDKLEDRMTGKLGKLPVTKDVMMLIKKNLLKTDWSRLEIRLLSAVFTLAW